MKTTAGFPKAQSVKSKLNSALLAASLCLPLSDAAFANVIITGVSSVSVPEDGANEEWSYTFINNTNSTISITGFTIVPISVTGDTSDFANSFGFSLGNCFSVAAFGTCDSLFSVSIENGTGETDGDFGQGDISVIFHTNAGDFSTPITTLTVSDPSVVATPIAGAGLPGVLSVLMGGGLFAWWRRRRKIA